MLVKVVEPISEILMTKKELVEYLSQFPDDMEVFKDYPSNDLPGNQWDYMVSAVCNPVKKRVGNHIGGYAVAQRACKETSETKDCIVL